MTDHPLSKSEIFFYGALSQRLSPLIDLASKSKSIDKWYPTRHEVYPSTVEPFSAIEQLAIEFGLARRVELEPAGDDEENPWNPEYRPPIPDDAVWTYADGQPLTDDELDEVMAKLDRAMAESHSGHDGTFCVDFVEKWTANIMSRMIDAIFGIPQWIPMTLREVCFHEVTESMGHQRRAMSSGFHGKGMSFVTKYRGKTTPSTDRSSTGSVTNSRSPHLSHGH